MTVEHILQMKVALDLENIMALALGGVFSSKPAG